MGEFLELRLLLEWPNVRRGQGRVRDPQRDPGSAYHPADHSRPQYLRQGHVPPDGFQAASLKIRWRKALIGTVGPVGPTAVQSSSAGGQDLCPHFAVKGQAPGAALVGGWVTSLPGGHQGDSGAGGRPTSGRPTLLPGHFAQRGSEHSGPTTSFPKISMPWCAHGSRKSSPPSSSTSPVLCVDVPALECPRPRPEVSPRSDLPTLVGPPSASGTGACCPPACWEKVSAGQPRQLWAHRDTSRWDLADRWDTQRRRGRIAPIPEMGGTGSMSRPRPSRRCASFRQSGWQPAWSGGATKGITRRAKRPRRRCPCKSCVTGPSWRMPTWPSREEAVAFDCQG